MAHKYHWYVGEFILYMLLTCLPLNYCEVIYDNSTTASFLLSERCGDKSEKLEPFQLEDTTTPLCFLFWFKLALLFNYRQMKVSNWEMQCMLLFAFY